MNIIAFIAINCGLVHLIEGLCAQMYYFWSEIIGGLRSHLLLFYFERKNMLKKKLWKQLVQDLISPPSIYMYMCTLYTYTNTYMPKFSPFGYFGSSRCLIPTPGLTSKHPICAVCVCARVHTHLHPHKLPPALKIEDTYNTPISPSVTNNTCTCMVLTTPVEIHAYSPWKMHMSSCMRDYATMQKLLCHGSYCKIISSLARALYRLSFAARPTAVSTKSVARRCSLKKFVQIHSSSWHGHRCGVACVAQASFNRQRWCRPHLVCLWVALEAWPRSSHIPEIYFHHFGRGLLGSKSNILAYSKSPWTGAHINKWLYWWSMLWETVFVFRTSHTARMIFLFFPSIISFISSFVLTALLMNSFHLRLYCYTLGYSQRFASSFFFFRFY